MVEDLGLHFDEVIDLLFLFDSIASLVSASELRHIGSSECNRYRI